MWMTMIAVAYYYYNCLAVAADAGAAVVVAFVVAAPAAKALRATRHIGYLAAYASPNHSNSN
jgi:hypothetical protein